MSKRQSFLKLKLEETRLCIKYSSVDNTAVLYEDDFKDGKLTAAGYNNLKEQCKTTNNAAQVEITVPENYKENFTELVESFAAKEIVFLNKKIRRIKYIVCSLMLVAIAAFILGELIVKAKIFNNLTVVASWVFTWTAIEKWFFEKRDLQIEKYKLLQIVSAEVVAIRNEES